MRPAGRRDNEGEVKVLLVSTDFNGRRRLRIAGLAATALAAGLLAGCKTADTLTPGETIVQGFVADQQTLDQIPVGSSREQVLLALGTPSTTATFDNEVFYYISQTRKRSFAFQNPHVVDQKVLAVYFGADSRVVKLANYGLQDGRVFDFISRTTPTGGKEQSFLMQLISGVGNFGPRLPNR